MAPRAFDSWSSGKDSAFALSEARRLGLAEIVGILTTVNEKYDRVAMHGVRHELLDRQIEALGLPAIKYLNPEPLSSSCDAGAIQCDLPLDKNTKAKGVLTKLLKSSSWMMKAEKPG